MLELLNSRFTEAIKKAFPESEAFAEVTESTNPQFGDYQCNNAMKLAKPLKQNPRAIAQKIIDQLALEDEEGLSICESPEIEGPGFINLRLTPHYLEKQLQRIATSDHLGIKPPKTPKTIVVEFSSPNTAKEMHVGHLRSTIIGDALARLFEFLGHNVIRLNHVGDWGTQFGMLIAYMKEDHPKVFSGQEEADLSDLMHWYREGKKRFDADPSFKERAQLEVVALQGGDKENLAAWETICEISRRGYQEIYDLLDIKIEEKGESHYNEDLPNIVEDLEKKNLLEVSDGAKCVFVKEYKNREGNPFPLMVQKSDGGFSYDTTDLAAIKHRVNDLKADQIIYVVDQGQSLHFNLVFKVAEMANYYDPNKIKIGHVPFGLVLGEDGKKFRTRSGETEKLIDLLNAAIERADTILQEKNPEMSAEDRASLAHSLGIAAVKYADLSVHRASDYQFSYDKMLKFEGNTAAFIMYSYVRVQGINKQSKVDSFKEAPFSIEHPQEIALAKLLVQFEDVLLSEANDLTPNKLTDYLFKLADTFNAFFRDCRVVGDPKEKNRLKLIDLVAKTFKQGLELLGIQAVHKM